MATFAEIKTRVERRVIDLPTSVQNEVGTLVNEALRTIQTRHNFKVMEAESGPTVTTEDSHTLLAVPSDFKEYRKKPYVLRDDGDSYPIQVLHSRGTVIRLFGDEANRDEGEPLVLLDAEPSDEAGTRNWEVWPYPDGNSDYSDGEYRVVVPYWKYLAALSADSDTNWFTVNAEEWLVNRATSEAFFLDWDEQRGTVWAERANAEFQKVVMRDKHFRMSGVDTLTLHLDVHAPQVRG